MTKRNGTITLTGDYRNRIHARTGSLSPTHERVAQYLLDNYREAAFQTAAQVADAVEADITSVVRFAQHLGYSGYPALLTSVRAQVKREMAEGYGDLGPAIWEVVKELSWAEVVYPDWPQDLFQAQSIVEEEHGEVAQVLNDIFIHDMDRPEKWQKLRKEAVQRAAMALRFLINLPEG